MGDVFMQKTGLITCRTKETLDKKIEELLYG